MGPLRTGKHKLWFQTVTAEPSLPPAQGLAELGFSQPSTHLLRPTGQDDQAPDGQHLHDGVAVAQAFHHPPQGVLLGDATHLLHAEQLREQTALTLEPRGIRPTVSLGLPGSDSWSCRLGKLTDGNTEVVSPCASASPASCPPPSFCIHPAAHIPTLASRVPPFLK